MAFSLIELLIAMAILSVGLIGAMRVFPVGLRASHRSERASRAAMLAQRTIESLKLRPWDELTEGDQPAIEEDGYTVTATIRQAVVEHVSDPTRLKVLEVGVSWDEDGRLRREGYVTYVRRPGS